MQGTPEEEKEVETELRTLRSGVGVAPCMQFTEERPVDRS